MRALNRALVRDFGRLRAQVATLSLVVAAGACVFVAMKLTVDALDGARSEYFRAQHLGDVFARLKRAPRALLGDLVAVAGVAQVDARVVGDVVVFVPGHAQPASVRLVSIDLQARTPLDALRLRRGRLPDHEHEDELVLNEPFADANRLQPGDSISAVLNGRLRRLRVVGVAISPEFVFQLPPGVISPNEERYGVAWMAQPPLAAAFDLTGAFNDIVVRLGPGAVRGDVIAALDRRLSAFGGQGAFPVTELPSWKMLDERIARLRGMLVFLPGLFLLVAAFVLNVVLGRLVEGQREQIGVLKAFGYGNGRLALHYLLLAAVTVLPGALVGVAGGLELGHALVRLFVHYFRLPLIGSAVDWSAIGGALAVVFTAAALGALKAVAKVTRLDPVEAMRAPSPPVFHSRRRGWLGRLGLGRRLPTALLLVMRNVRLAPTRSLASIAALGFATALCVTGSFLGGALDALMRLQFDGAMREDLTVAFVRPLSPDLCPSLRAVEGVVACEPLLAAAVHVRLGPRQKQVAMSAFGDGGGQLRRLVDRAGQVVGIPPTGLVVSRRLLDQLGAGLGDRLTVETIEGRRRSRALPVMVALDDSLGLNVYVSPATLTTFLGETPPMTLALLRVAPGRESRVAALLARMPTIGGVTSRQAAIADFEKATAEQMRVMTAILALLAAVLAIAVVYNGARVALAERARDLASLRVLGFTRAEVARILLGEMALVVGLGVPLGLLLGRGLAGLTVRGMGSDQFRLPLVITPGTYLLATLVVVGASLLSALQLIRLIDRLDLVEVLKTRE